MSAINPTIYEKAILEAKIKVLEEELIRIGNENASLKTLLGSTREENATLEPAKSVTEVDFQAFASEMKERVRLMEKTMQSEITFNEKFSTNAWFKANKKFIIKHMINGSIVFRYYGCFDIIVKYDDSQFIIQYDKSCDHYSEMIEIASIIVDGKIVWENSKIEHKECPGNSVFNQWYRTGRVDYDRVHSHYRDISSKYDAFVKAATDWVRHLQKYPDTTEKFDDELKKLGII